MADSISQAKRSAVMAAVKSCENKTTELKFIQILRKFGLNGWRRKQHLVGKPDFIFRNKKLAIFIDGCFWHGCSLCYRRPKSNQGYWDKKVQRNRSRDTIVSQSLEMKGWRVLRIWEHELNDSKSVAERVRKTSWDLV